jgi:hypothetical protein
MDRRREKGIRRRHSVTLPQNQQGVDSDERQQEQERQARSPIRHREEHIRSPIRRREVRTSALRPYSGHDAHEHRDSFEREASYRRTEPYERDNATGDIQSIYPHLFIYLTFIKI